MAGLLAVNFFLFFDGDDAPTPTLEQRLGAPAAGGEGSGTTVAPGEAPGAPGVAPDLRSGPEERDDFGEPVGRKVAGALQRGQTILRALGEEGLDQRAAMPVVRAMEDVFDFRQAQVGQTFEAVLDDEGQIRRFTYVQSPLDVFVVDLQEDGGYVAAKKAIPTRVELAKLGCTVKSSLYEAMRRCGGGPQLASLFIDLFAWDLDFFQDARKGDTFRVIVEKISVDGKFLKYGNVLAAEYRGKFGEQRIVHYTAPDGRDGWFTPDGRAIRKDFLKSPLKYTRVSARGQSGIRGSLKKASPVVYTAQAGTPVQAVGGGTVVFAGESGSLGRTVTIRHDNGYTSTYGHLDELGRGVKVGRLVNQKTVIGRVGQTGRAKEPKLLFSLRKDGRLVNPLTMRFTEADPVPDEFLDHFERQSQELLEDLESTRIQGLDHNRG